MSIHFDYISKILGFFCLKLSQLSELILICSSCVSSWIRSWTRFWTFSSWMSLRWSVTSKTPLQMWVTAKACGSITFCFLLFTSFKISPYFTCLITWIYQLIKSWMSSRILMVFKTTAASSLCLFAKQILFQKAIFWILSYLLYQYSACVPPPLQWLLWNTTFQHWANAGKTTFLKFWGGNELNL